MNRTRLCTHATARRPNLETNKLWENYLTKPVLADDLKKIIKTEIEYFTPGNRLIRFQKKSFRTLEGTICKKQNPFDFKTNAMFNTPVISLDWFLIDVVTNILQLVLLTL